MGKIKKTWLGRFGAEARLNVAGRVGLEYGYYIDSGTLDVNYSGLLSYNISTENGKTRLATALDIEDASLYTVSPRVGAYVDLVIDLDAAISAKACFVGCYGAILSHLHPREGTHRLRQSAGRRRQLRWVDQIRRRRNAG